MEKMSYPKLVKKTFVYAKMRNLFFFQPYFSPGVLYELGKFGLRM